MALFLPTLRYADMHDIMALYGTLWTFMNFIRQFIASQDGSTGTAPRTAETANNGTLR